MAEVSFQREPLASIRGDQLNELLEAHYLEIAHFKDIPLGIDWPVYELLEQAHKLRAFTARAGQRLIGYAAFMVGQAPHYMTSLQSVQDVFYITPECRHQSIGYRFMAWCDRQLASEGVQAGYQHSKVAAPMDPMLRRQRYEMVDTLWVKRFDLWAPPQR